MFCKINAQHFLCKFKYFYYKIKETPQKVWHNQSEFLTQCIYYPAVSITLTKYQIYFCRALHTGAHQHPVQPQHWPGAVGHDGWRWALHSGGRDGAGSDRLLCHQRHLLRPVQHGLRAIVQHQRHGEQPRVPGRVHLHPVGRNNNRWGRGDKCRWWIIILVIW